MSSCDYSLEGVPRASHLEKFLPGAENHLAAAVVDDVLKNPIPDDGPRGYNPLVLSGPTGCGKTLLVGELAAAWQRRHASLPVIHKPAVEFAQEFNEAVETQDVDQFRRTHRLAGLLIVEDIHRLQGKETAQRELRETVDAIIRNRRRCVATADQPPGRWSAISPDLQSRLASGLSVGLVYPGPESRLKIIQRLATDRKIDLSPEAAALIAANVAASAVNLTGALNQLELEATRDGKTTARITVEDVRRYFSRRQGPRQPELREIAMETARSFSLKVMELRGPSRARTVVTARDVAMYVARRLTQNSLQQIGRYFGGRDHTTVLHGCRKTEKLLNTEPAVQRAVEQVQNKILAAG